MEENAEGLHSIWFEGRVGEDSDFLPFNSREIGSKKGKVRELISCTFVFFLYQEYNHFPLLSFPEKEFLTIFLMGAGVISIILNVLLCEICFTCFAHAWVGVLCTCASSALQGKMIFNY